MQILVLYKITDFFQDIDLDILAETQMCIQISLFTKLHQTLFPKREKKVSFSTDFNMLVLNIATLIHFQRIVLLDVYGSHMGVPYVNLSV